MAFLNHLRHLYVKRSGGTRVKISNAHGKGPGGVVDSCMGQLRRNAYDDVAVFMDTDLPISQEVRESAAKGCIDLIDQIPKIAKSSALVTSSRKCDIEPMGSFNSFLEMDEIWGVSKSNLSP